MSTRDELEIKAQRLRDAEESLARAKSDLADEVEAELARGVTKKAISRRIGFHTATVLRWTRRKEREAT